MKEKYEVDNNLIQEKTEYDKEKLAKKLKIVRNEFTTVGKYNMPLIKKQEIEGTVGIVIYPFNKFGAVK